MVTANNVCNRFKKKSIMSDSYVERYMRAKRRKEVTPQCLFGTPSETETDQFLSQQDVKEEGENQKALEKYDLTDIPKDFFENIVNVTDKETASTSGQSTSTSEGLKFQPRIITDDDPPPTKNLFLPIDKLKSASPEFSEQLKLTDYWQTSKRRRASSNPTEEELETKNEETNSGEHGSDKLKKENDPKDNN